MPSARSRTRKLSVRHPTSSSHGKYDTMATVSRQQAARAPARGPGRGVEFDSRRRVSRSLVFGNPCGEAACGQVSLSQLVNDESSVALATASYLSLLASSFFFVQNEVSGHFSPGIDGYWSDPASRLLGCEILTEAAMQGNSKGKTDGIRDTSTPPLLTPSERPGLIECSLRHRGKCSPRRLSFSARILRVPPG